MRRYETGPSSQHFAPSRIVVSHCKPSSTWKKEKDGCPSSPGSWGSSPLLSGCTGHSLDPSSALWRKFPGILLSDLHSGWSPGSPLLALHSAERLAALLPFSTALDRHPGIRAPSSLCLFGPTLRGHLPLERSGHLPRELPQDRRKNHTSTRSQDLQIRKC